MKKRFTYLLTGLLLGTFSLLAAPAIPTPFQMTQPDGTTITVRMVGDEFGHYQVTEDNIPVAKGEDGFFRYVELSSTGEVVAGEVIARNVGERTAADKAYLETLPKEVVAQTFEGRRLLRQQEAQANKVTTRSVASTTGDVKRLVLLVQFSDVQFQYSQSDFYNMLNQEGYDYNGAPGSARDYFIDQSDGKYTPSFDVYGPFTLSKTRAYYGADSSNGSHDANRDELCYDVCDVANSSVDFSQYADGSNVDMIYIFYAGYSQSESGNTDDIWAHQTDLGTSLFNRYDGKNILSYACSSELQGGSGTTRSGIGVFIHEFSHTLGLPDFYDTDRSGQWGMGYWSVMSYGNHSNNGHCPVGYTAYERAFCGWMNLTDLPTTPATISLENLADSKTAYKLSSSDANQYFVLENRQKSRWDSHMPSSGLMITKVDYDYSAWNSNDVNISSRQRMTVMPADNSTSNESGDLYPYNGNNSFTSTSTPASVTNTGIVIDCPITGIMQQNGVITFDVMGGVAPDAPVAQTATDITQVKFTANWTAVAGATYYDLVIGHYKSDDTEVTSQTIKNLTTTSYTVTELNPDYYYVYYVTAVNGNNGKVSETSNSVKVEMSDEPALPTPTGVEVYDIGEMSFKVKWNKITDASGYKIRVTRRHVDGTSDLDWVEIREIYYNSTSMIINKLEQGYVYYCQIQAYNWNGNSNYSDVVTVNLKDPDAVPDAPVAQEATDVTQVKFTAKWSVVSGATNYDLIVEHYNKTTNVLEDTQTLSDLTGSSHVVTDLDNDHYYVYYVIAKNADNGKSSEASNRVRVNMSIAPALPTPSGVEAYDIEKDAFKVRWDEVSNALGYNVQAMRWYTDGTFDYSWSVVDVVPSGTTTYSLENLELNYVYGFKVQAYNKNGKGYYSDEITIELNSLGLDVADKVATKVYGQQGAVMVECEGRQSVVVYTLLGNQLLSTTIDGCARLPLSAGIYIVRCGERAYRVAVR